MLIFFLDFCYTSLSASLGTFSSTFCASRRKFLLLIIDVMKYMKTITKNVISCDLGVGQYWIDHLVNDIIDSHIQFFKVMLKQSD